MFQEANWQQLRPSQAYPWPPRQASLQAMEGSFRLSIKGASQAPKPHPPNAECGWDAPSGSPTPARPLSHSDSKGQPRLDSFFPTISREDMVAQVRAEFHV